MMVSTTTMIRRLADALSRQRQADEHGIYCAVPRQAVDAAIRHLRAQADAQPVAAVPAGWKPVRDDGDALRLAVRLNLFNGAEFYHFRSLERFGRQDEDDLAATRRAIVRAAAEIGRQHD